MRGAVNVRTTIDGRAYPPYREVKGLGQGLNAATLGSRTVGVRRPARHDGLLQDVGARTQSARSPAPCTTVTRFLSHCSQAATATACQWAIFLRNHDELTLEMVTSEERAAMYGWYAEDPRMRANVGIRRRLAPLLGHSRAEIELAHALLLSLPGSPCLYYGDEIGMGDNIWLSDRDAVRTPA